MGRLVPLVLLERGEGVDDANLEAVQIETG